MKKAYIGVEKTSRGVTYYVLNQVAMPNNHFRPELWRGLHPEDAKAWAQFNGYRVKVQKNQ